MAATTSQGKSFTLFITGLTAAAAGIAYFSTAGGKASLVIGLVILGISAVSLIKLKPLEGVTGSTPQPAVLKLAGLAASVLGWCVALLGIHLSSSVGGRMCTAILGLAVSLVGVTVLLPAAANKNAIWKA